MRCGFPVPGVSMRLAANNDVTGSVVTMRYELGGLIPAASPGEVPGLALQSPNERVWVEC